MSALIFSLPLSEQIEAIYIGYFGRAAEAGGLAYWEQTYNTEIGAGQSPSTALANIANDFAPQPETLSLYPFLAQNLSLLPPATVTTDLDNLVSQIYQNLFGRPAGSGDTGYWVPEIQSGEIPLGQAILAIANGAIGEDATILTDRINEAASFTSATGAAGLGVSGPLSSAFTQEANFVVQSITPTNTAAAIANANACITAFVDNGGSYFVNNPTVSLTDNLTPGPSPHTTVEGNTITFTVVDPNMPNNGTEAYTLSGAVGQVSGATSGTITLVDGVGTLSVHTLVNVLGGPNQALTLTVGPDGISGSPGNITQTDMTSIAEAQQSLSGGTSVLEGSTLVATVSTTGVTPISGVSGLQENYTITGAGTGQLTSPLTGTITLNPAGQAPIPLATAATVFNMTAAADPTVILTVLNSGSSSSSATQTSETVTINERALLSSTDNAPGSHAPVQTIVGTSNS